MAIALRPTHILLWSAAIAGSAVLGIALLMQDARPLQVAAEPACLALPSNLRRLGPALASKEIVRAHVNPEWESLKAGMRPGDTVHEFETGVTGGLLMLRGSCYLGQTVDWIR
jgi:hypothetical protein